MPWGWGWLFATAIAGPPAVVPAKPAQWELQWQAPGECPDAEALRARVEALQPSLAGGQGVLYVDARVDAAPAGFVLRLHTTFLDRDDTRALTGATCDAVVDAVALVVAVSLDPSLAGAPTSNDPPTTAVVPEPEPEPEPQPPPERVADPTAPDEPRPSVAPTRDPTPPRRRRTAAPPAMVWARVGAQLGIGSLPAWSGGAEVAVGLGWSHWRVDVHGTWLAPRRADGPDPTGARVQLGTAGLRGCGLPYAGPVGIPICAGIEAGGLRGDSIGLAPATTVVGPWLSPTLGAGVTWGGRRLGLWSLLEATFAPVRSQLLVGERAIFRPAPVAGRLVVGLEVYFAIKSR